MHSSAIGSIVKVHGEKMEWGGIPRSGGKDGGVLLLVRWFVIDHS